MAKKTIAELREMDIRKLAERSSSPEAMDNARKALNSFYRLAGFSERVFYINNDERLYTRYSKNGRLEKMEEREAAWIKRLNTYLKELECEVTFNGVYPSIVVFGEYHRIDEVVISGHWYQ